VKKGYRLQKGPWVPTIWKIVKEVTAPKGVRKNWYCKEQSFEGQNGQQYSILPSCPVRRILRLIVDLAT
jgi:hypothetical protein